MEGVRGAAVVPGSVLGVTVFRAGEGDTKELIVQFSVDGQPQVRALVQYRSERLDLTPALYCNGNANLTIAANGANTSRLTAG